MAGLHILIIRSFLFTPPVTMPVQPVVQVSLQRPATPPPLPPPPVSLIAPRPTVPVPPVIALVPPPPAPNAPVAAYGPPSPPSIAVAPTPPPPSSDYLRRLAAHIVTYKRARDEVRRRPEQGIVRLHLVFDRNGHVLSCTVVGSSGSTALDNAALQLIKRAEPLPPVPSDYPGERVDLIVPVEVSVR